MDMRLGKTLTTIRRVMMYPNATKVLVVAPNSALGGWEEELEKEGIDYERLSGTKEQRYAKLMGDCFWSANYYLINKEGWLSIPEIKNITWDVVILDESTFIKNPKAKVTRFFLKNFRKVPHRWILTGLPNPESDLDYITQFLFLDGHFMGKDNYWKFRDRYYKLGPDTYSYVPKPGVSEAIQKYVGKRAHILKRKEAGLNTEKIYETRYLDFDDKTRTIYQEAEKDFILRAGTFEQKTVWKMVQYTWLRQLCGGWIKKEKQIWDGKVKELVSLLEGELRNEKVVVWFNYNMEIKSCIKALCKTEAACITGQQDPELREALRKEFQTGHTRVLLIQQAVAQMGMDLSAADTAIYFSEPLGLQGKKQTEDRIVHPEKTTPLLYIHLLVNDSVDIDIRYALAQKALKSDLSIYNALRYSMERRVK
jgi:SNF2 family DNA or RNA helicase